MPHPDRITPRPTAASLLCALVWPVLCCQPAHAADSAYTGLDEGSCVLLQVDAKAAWSFSECPAFGGWRVLLEDADGRQSLSVVDPAGRPHDLDFSRTVTPAFSTLGNKLEWRFHASRQGVDPYALIVRVNAADDGEGARSWLAVIRLQDPACVVARIPPGSGQNLAARAAADDRELLACR